MSSEAKTKNRATRRGGGTAPAPTRGGGHDKAPRSGYSGTPLWKKLGYKDSSAVYLDGAPADYVAKLHLPADISVQWVRRETTGVSFIHLFTTSKSVLKMKLEGFRGLLAPAGVLWVSWPKKNAGITSDITEDIVREAALPLGLVDIKVCAVDEIWSGLKLVIRKELR
jgi:hypothetical protein